MNVRTTLIIAEHDPPCAVEVERGSDPSDGIWLSFGKGPWKLAEPFVSVLLEDGHAERLLAGLLAALPEESIARVMERMATAAGKVGE